MKGVTKNDTQKRNAEAFVTNNCWQCSFFFLARERVSIQYNTNTYLKLNNGGKKKKERMGMLELIQRG